MYAKFYLVDLILFLSVHLFAHILQALMIFGQYKDIGHQTFQCHPIPQIIGSLPYSSYISALEIKHKQQHIILKNTLYTPPPPLHQSKMKLSPHSVLSEKKQCKYSRYLSNNNFSLLM